MALSLIAILSYNNYSDLEPIVTSDNSINIDKKSKNTPNQARTQEAISQRDKVTLTANQEVKGINIQFLLSKDLETIAASTSSMNELINKLSHEYKYPISLSLNVLLTAISNFENDLKYDLLFNQKSAYKDLLNLMAETEKLPEEIKGRFVDIKQKIANQENSTEATQAFISLIEQNEEDISAALAGSKLTDKIQLTNDFFYGNRSIADTKNFEETYTRMICNTEGESLKEKRLNFKEIQGNSILESQLKNYDYTLRVLPRRLPITKQYERHLLDAFNTLHIPDDINRKEISKEYALNENKDNSAREVELLADFYLRQVQFYTTIEENGQAFLSKDFLSKVSIIKEFFGKLNSAQSKISKNKAISTRLSSSELAVINFDRSSQVTVNTIGLDDRSMKISASLEPSAALKVQLFNKKQPRAIIPFHQKTNFKMLVTDK